MYRSEACPPHDGKDAPMQTNPTRLLLLAAESGDAAAQFNLAVLCDSRLDDNGYPIEGNRTAAMKWLLAAAEQGLPRAQSKLAEMYADGPAAPEDDINACVVVPYRDNEPGRDPPPLSPIRIQARFLAFDPGAACDGEASCT
jgi:hypothetical protein